MTQTERQAWLEERRSGIGSSDVAPILGLSPWATALDVYHSKVTPGHEAEMNAAMEWGHRLEPAIAGAIIDRYGWSLTRGELVRHPDYDFLFANPDRINLDGELIEIKTSSTSEGWGEAETDEIPLHYWVQVQHQLECLHHVTGCELAWVCVLFSGREFRRYRVPYDRKHLETVLPALDEFWQCVLQRTPPEPDWSHDGIAESVIRNYRPEEGKAVELSHDLTPVIEEYDRLGAEIRSMEKAREMAKARILAAMAGAEIGLAANGAKVSARVTERKEYIAKATSYVNFRITKPKERNQ